MTADWTRELIDAGYLPETAINLAEDERYYPPEPMLDDEDRWQNAADDLIYEPRWLP